MEKKFTNRHNLSVSSTASSSSTISTSLSSPGLTPRKGLLSQDYLLPGSPPPSPGLPSLIPRHGKKSQTSLLWKLRRVVVIFGAVLVLTWLAMRLFLYPTSTPAVPSGDYEIVGADALPEEPSAIMLDDKKGRKKWTVSIPAHHDFPLPPSRYHEICQQAEHITRELHPSKKTKRHAGYYEHDSHFVDVAEAQKQGLLPNVEEGSKLVEGVLAEEAAAGHRTCKKSLTYVMETSEAGMGSTLMGMWTAYGLAKKEGRAFFVDDTRWPYGNFSQYFAVPRHPNCLPPPSVERLPCPHSAKHLVVSAATFPFTFGPAFTAQFTDVRKSSEAARRKPMFDLLRAGYEELFHLADQGDADYVQQRVDGMFQKVRKNGGSNVGIHIRRGDVHPWDYQYEKDYLPLVQYMDEARQILYDKYEHDEVHEEDEELPTEGKGLVNGLEVSTEGAAPKHTDEAGKQQKKKRSKLNGTGLMPRHGAPGLMASSLYIASDDADVYAAPEVARTIRAQDRIVLASKTVLEAASGGRTNPWIDEIHGWEGGFYRDQFFGLGRPDADRFKYLSKWAHAPDSSNEQDTSSSLEFGRVGGVMLEDENPDNVDPPPEAAMAMRSLVGRAYLMDLAVLSQGDAVVCAVSASACRILAVMMGWDKAMVENKWRNVDGGFSWRGLIVPE